MRACQLLAVSVAASITAAFACRSSPTQPEPPPPSVSCTFQLATASASFGFQGGTSSITVSTAATCAWTARSDADWVTIQSGASGTGAGTIAVAIVANPDAGAREASVSVADQSVKLTQQGRAPCTYAIAPDNAWFVSDGGTGSIRITAASHCAWTAVSSDAWIALAAASGTGDGVVTYTVSAWTGDAERSATIRVEGQNVTIRQARDPRTCAYAVTPVDVVLHWHGPGGEIRVTTDADCTWTVRAAADWLDVAGAGSRSGSGVAPFSADTLAEDSTRRAAVELRWPAPSAGQNVWITQEGCRYGAYPATVSIPAAGGSEYVNVLTQPISASCSLACTWTAVPSASWIRVAAGSPGAGDSRFRVEVGPNAGGARTGTIRVGGQTITIAQAGA